MDANTLDAEPLPAASQMDLEHREILESLSGFRSAVNLGRPAGELAKNLAAFIATIEKHFASEEELMRSEGYGEAATHAAEHQRLFGQLQSLREGFDSGAINPGGALALFVEVWTVQHMERHDKPFVEYLNARGGTA